MKKYRNIILSAVILLCVSVFVISLAENDRNRDKGRVQPVEFNEAERRYMAEKDSVGIYVTDDLSFLCEGEENYLSEYLDTVFEPSGLDVVFCEDEKDADAVLAVVDRDMRENEDISFTAPLFQIDGKLYAKDGYKEEDTLEGAVTAGRISSRKLEKICYGDTEIIWTEVEGDVLEYARKNGTEIILGDECHINLKLASEGGYIGVKENIYSSNACMITDKESAVLHSIINQCVHSADRKRLSYMLSEKWMKGDGPLYMEKDFGDVYMLILIVFFAVFIAFYIYYLSNRNLYSELQERMSKLAESKGELKTTLSNVSYLMAELDSNGKIKDINKAFYDFADKNLIGADIWEYLGMERGSCEGEVTINKKTLDVSIFPVEKSDKLLFMAKDVTNERAAERQLLQDNKMIAVGQLAAGVAHEIRNPLGIIRNYCYVLKNMNDEEVRKKAIEQIEKSVDNSSAIITRLLDFSKISPGLSKEIDIREHIRSLALINEGMLKKKKIKFSLVGDENIWSDVYVESLDMILINLISNAVDAMEDEGCLTITLKRNEESYSIEVKDTGCGIDEEETDELFNPFFTTKSKSGGTGLGLYIVYNEVMKMDGNIEVSSRVGEGTVFTISLPLKGERV